MMPRTVADRRWPKKIDPTRGWAICMTNIHELRDLSDRAAVFSDRLEAGDVLAKMLAPLADQSRNLFVLAIPSGGVPVGLRISSILQADFDLLIVRKIQMPGNTESGIGAVTHEGSVFLNERLLAQINLSPRQIQDETDKVVRELERRNRLFRGDAPAVDVTGRTVILVDDGLASGYTMLAAVYAVKKMEPEQVIIAVPTAPARSIRLFDSKVDAVYCANIRHGLYFAVAEAYRHWYDLNSQEVVEMLHK
jgi:predicted phosphoribosyltransferase